MKQKIDKIKRKVGRPTDYNKDVIGKVNKYLEEEAGKGKGHLPKIESFAIYLGVERKTLYNWAEVHPEFKTALNKIMAYQLVRLIDDGIYMGKAVNAAIIKMMLVNNHNMKDEISNKLSGEVINKFNDEQISRIAERITSRKGNAGPTSSTK